MTVDIIVQTSGFIRIFFYSKIARNSTSNKKYQYLKKTMNFRIFGIDDAGVNVNLQIVGFIERLLK